MLEIKIHLFIPLATHALRGLSVPVMLRSQNSLAVFDYVKA